MAIVKFTYALKRFYPGLTDTETRKTNINELIQDLETRYPGLRAYLVDDQGSLRQHVNIFLDGELMKDRKNLMDTVHEQSEVYIMQALSGG